MANIKCVPSQKNNRLSHIFSHGDRAKGGGYITFTFEMGANIDTLNKFDRVIKKNAEYLERDLNCDHLARLTPTNTYANGSGRAPDHRLTYQVQTGMNVDDALVDVVSILGSSQLLDDPEQKKINEIYYKGSINLENGESNPRSRQGQLNKFNRRKERQEQEAENTLVPSRR